MSMQSGWAVIEGVQPPLVMGGYPTKRCLNGRVVIEAGVFTDEHESDPFVCAAAESPPNLPETENARRRSFGFNPRSSRPARLPLSDEY